MFILRLPMFDKVVWQAIIVVLPMNNDTVLNTDLCWEACHQCQKYGGFLFSKIM